MQLSETNLYHIYLHPLFFSYAQYIGPACLAALALVCFFLALRLYKVQKKSLTRDIASIETYLHISLLIGIGLGAALWSFGLFREAYEIKHSQFKTDPIMTLSNQGIANHRRNTMTYWRDIKDIELRRIQRRKSVHHKIDILLIHGDSISFEDDYSADLTEITNQMRSFWRTYHDAT